jgi:hypothetical protein
MIPFLTNLFAGKAKDLAKTAFEGLDSLFTSKEEKAAAELKAEQELNRHLEALIEQGNHQLELILQDKQSAREMYKFNSSLQKIYALCFLGMYTILATVILWNILAYAKTGEFKISEFGSMFISTLFGGMSAKLSTITDFLFGSGMQTPPPSESVNIKTTTQK